MGVNHRRHVTGKPFELDADIVIMLHPDYQYNATALNPGNGKSYRNSVSIRSPIPGSRILGNSALTGGMPKYKTYFANSAPYFIQNVLMNQRAHPSINYRFTELILPRY